MPDKSNAPDRFGEEATLEHVRKLLNPKSYRCSEQVKGENLGWCFNHPEHGDCIDEQMFYAIASALRSAERSAIGRAKEAVEAIKTRPSYRHSRFERERFGTHVGAYQHALNYAFDEAKEHALEAIAALTPREGE